MLEILWRKKFIILAVIGWCIIGSLLYISEKRERKIPEKADLVYGTYFYHYGG